MSAFKKCNRNRCCKFLAERTVCGLGGGEGLHTVVSLNTKTGKAEATRT